MNSDTPTPRYSDTPTHVGDDVVLSVRNVSKKFCKRLRRSMAYGIKDLACNLSGIKQDTTKLRRDEFWALDDVSFELRRGEVLGLIGGNGSGKTTLLRLLSGIFPPDKGEISIRGRVGALIAVGAGFHPYMTGRENVYLNASILGLSHSETEAQFDEIVDFAEIGDFIDAPVATYSSGMYVRLGFSIAVQIEPDLLLVDEVLAVGDSAFRVKCLNRIYDMLQNTAVVFVSHSMPQVARICTSASLMKSGRATLHADTNAAIQQYLASTERQVVPREMRSDDAEIHSVAISQTGVTVSSERAEDKGQLAYKTAFRIAVDVELREGLECELNIQFLGDELQTVCVTNSRNVGQIVRGSGTRQSVVANYSEMLLAPGNYYLSVTITHASTNHILSQRQSICRFSVTGSAYGGQYPRRDPHWEGTAMVSSEGPSQSGVGHE